MTAPSSEGETRRPAGPSNRFLSVVLAAVLLAGIVIVAMQHPGKKAANNGDGATSATTTTTTAPSTTTTALSQTSTTGQSSGSTSTGPSTTSTSSSTSSGTRNNSTTTSTSTPTGSSGGKGSTTTSVPVHPQWRVAWGSAMAWGWGVAYDTTVRELVTVPVSGSAVRFRLSNLFGNAPLQVEAATVAQSAGGGAIVSSTLKKITFAGAASTSVPIGATAYTDPIFVPVTAGETFAISLYVSGADLVTQHPWGFAPVSFFTRNGGGNVTSYAGSVGWISSPFPRWVDAADVLSLSPPSIVVVGDSITDGFNATTSWTDVLQRREDALPVRLRRAIVNEGISANTLTAYVPNYSKVGGGLPGLQRMATDALQQPGASEVVLFLGTNDIWFGTPASELVQGYEQAISMAHDARMKIVAVTLTPRSSNPKEPWTPYEQQQLEIADHWILTSGKFDGVIDMAPAVADVYDGSCDPIAMYPLFDSGDHLHPNAAGQTAMGNSIDPTVLGLPHLAQVPPLVPARRTPGCDAGMPAPAAMLPPPSTAPTTTSPQLPGPKTTTTLLGKSSPTPPALNPGTTTTTRTGP